MLSKQQKQFCQKIYQAAENRAYCVNSPAKMDKKAFMDSIIEARYMYPELFYLDFRQITSVKHGDYYEYRLAYLYPEESIRSKQEAIEAEVRCLFRELGLERDASVYQKCGLIHNYLLNTCSYDYEALDNRDNTPEAWTIEGVFLKKTAVCLGISLAFQFLCSRLRINTMVACGFSLQPGATSYGGHAWNIVCVGEHAAHVDVTWDMCLSKSSPVIRYDYFFLPDLEAMRDHQYVGYPICRQLKSSYFEKTGTQFESLDALGAYIERGAAQAKRENFSRPLYFQFKMKNRKESKEEIFGHIRQILCHTLCRSYSGLVYANEVQSVFLYSVSFD